MAKKSTNPEGLTIRQIFTRVSPAEHAEVVAAAHRTGRTLSGFVRFVVINEAAKVNRRAATEEALDAPGKSL